MTLTSTLQHAILRSYTLPLPRCLITTANKSATQANYTNLLCCECSTEIGDEHLTSGKKAKPAHSRILKPEGIATREIQLRWTRARAEQAQQSLIYLQPFQKPSPGADGQIIMASRRRNVQFQHRSNGQNGRRPSISESEGVSEPGSPTRGNTANGRLQPSKEEVCAARVNLPLPSPKADVTIGRRR